MAYNPVTWANRDPVTAVKLQQMADNEAYLKSQVDQKMPYGILGAAERTTSSAFLGAGGGAPSVNIPGLDVTVTVGSNRILEVELFVCSWTADSDDVLVYQQIVQGSTILNSTAIYLPLHAIGSGGGVTKALVLPSAGTLTFHGAGQITHYSISPTVTINADANRYSYLIVKDIGSTNGISVPQT